MSGVLGQIKLFSFIICGSFSSVSSFLVSNSIDAGGLDAFWSVALLVFIVGLLTICVISCLIQRKRTLLSLFSRSDYFWIMAASSIRCPCRVSLCDSSEVIRFRRRSISLSFSFSFVSKFSSDFRISCLKLTKSLSRLATVFLIVAKDFSRAGLFVDVYGLSRHASPPFGLLLVSLMFLFVLVCVWRCGWYSRSANLFRHIC